MLIALLVAGLHTNTAFAQCTISATPVGPLTICLGAGVNLQATGSCANYLMNNDFNTSTIGAGWSSNSTPTFTNPCPCANIVNATSVYDGTPYLWIGSASSFPRNLTTVPYPVTASCQICFDFIMSTQGDPSPCEGPDEMDEGISLQYSTNGGGTWTDITYFCPDGNQYPTNSWVGLYDAGWSGFNAFNAWGNYCFNVPAGGAGPNTQFQWHQEQVTASTNDHWGIDNVEITCPVPGIVYTWTDNGVLFSSVEDPGMYYPTVGNHSIVVTISNGGFNATQTILVTVYDTPTSSFTVNPNPVCTGSNALITYTGNGVATDTYTWNWGGGTVVSGAGAGPYNISWATAGTYNVTLTTSRGTCTSTITVPVTVQNCGCVVNAGLDVSSCGLSTNMTAITQAGDYNLLWTGPAGITINPTNSPTALVTATASGVYNLTWSITNSVGTTCVDNATVTFTANPTSTFTATPISCFGQNSTITYTGTTSVGSTYSWTFGGGTIVSGTNAGPYTVNWGTSGLQTITLQVSDNHCLSPITTVQVNNPPDLTYSINVGTLPCASSTGQATPVPSGGTPPYSYTWSNVTGPPFTAGNYIGTVTDFLGCTESYPFTVTSPNNITVLPNQTNLTCYNNASGTAQVTASGGTGPYTYTWTGGVSNTSLASNLAAGNYTVTVTDVNGCTITSNFVISQPAQINLQIVSTTNTSCSGICDGMATVSANGGSPGVYGYLWPGGGMTASATGLCAGNYIVTTSDANMCTTTTTVTITQPSPITASISNTTNINCFGQCTGSATVSASNGTIPYSFSWPGGANGATANNLCVGSYIVTASDNNGCSTTATAIISQPVQITASTTNIIDANCFFQCNGSATAVPSGGTPPYSYQWNSGTPNSAINSTLCNGTQYVTITDVFGCTATAQAIIGEPAQLVISSIVKTNITCHDANDGTITVEANGGTPTYLYTLGSQIETVGDFIDLSGGNYTVLVTDAHGCTVSGSTSLFEPSPIIVSAITTHSICPGEYAYLTANSTGGTPAYTYYWDGIASNPSIGVNPLTTTNYTVSVTDSRGCTSNSVIVSVLVSLPLVVDVIASPTSICPGDTTQLSVSISQGGGPPYMVYNTQGDVLIPPIYISPATSGLEYLYVRDGCNSVAHDSIYITVNPNPPISFVSDTISGCEPLTVSFNSGSSLPGQTYFWNFGDASYNAISYDMNPIHEFTQDGIFDVSLTVTSAQGCISTLLHPEMISVWPAPNARFIADPTTASIIKPQIIFTNLSEFASSYIWSFGDGDSSSIENPVHWYPGLGNYIVYLIAITEKNCTDTVNNVIVIRDEYTFYAPNAISPDFDDINDVFYIIGNGISSKDFQLYIFDRWGEVIYNTDKYDAEQPAKYGWDGSVKDKSIAPIGTYTWMVEYYDGDKIQHIKSGIVNVVR